MFLLITFCTFKQNISSLVLNIFLCYSEKIKHKHQLFRTSSYYLDDYLLAVLLHNMLNFLDLQNYDKWKQIDIF